MARFTRITMWDGQMKDATCLARIKVSDIFKNKSVCTWKIIACDLKNANDAHFGDF